MPFFPVGKEEPNNITTCDLQLRDKNPPIGTIISTKASIASLLLLLLVLLLFLNYGISSSSSSSTWGCVITINSETATFMDRIPYNLGPFLLLLPPSLYSPLLAGWVTGQEQRFSAIWTSLCCAIDDDLPYPPPPPSQPILSCSSSSPRPTK